jgi:phosphoribosyl-ATP pyrophosphohydrolase
VKRDLNLSRTIDIIKSRKQSDPSESYVAALLKASDSVVLKKIIEESTELVIAASLEKRECVLHESADLLFHYLVLLEKLDISLDEVVDVLIAREGVSGFVEKESRKQE